MSGRFRKFPPFSLFISITKPFGLRFPSNDIQEITLSNVKKQIQKKELNDYFENLPNLCMYYFPCRSPHIFLENQIDLDIDKSHYNPRKCLMIIRDLAKIFQYQTLMIQHHKPPDSSLLIIHSSLKSKIPSLISSRVPPSAYHRIVKSMTVKMKSQLNLPENHIAVLESPEIYTQFHHQLQHQLQTHSPIVIEPKLESIKNQRIKITNPTVIQTFSKLDQSGNVYYANLQDIFPGAISLDS